MLTRSEFLEAYPEFVEVDTSLVDAKLAEASRRIHPATWGVHENDGHGQLTAHLLANSPMGNAAKLAGAPGVTTYLPEYDRLVRIVAAGIRST